MEILGIGPLELIFILLIALIIFGPNDMVKAGRSVGKFMRRIVTSDGWRTFQKASRDIRRLPNQLMRDAGLEEIDQEMRKISGFSKETSLKDTDAALQAEMKEIQAGLSAWTTPPKPEPPNAEKQAAESPPQDGKHSAESNPSPFSRPAE
ncbi:MAG: twin-arginine translocase TatA/TatE family subunit [Anaerolineales bacterium]|nr:twin-arginine translocase TatA/TatE family subunit [Anaerolineales bacterium]